MKFGLEHWFRYFQKVAAFPQMTMPGEQIDEMIDVINDNGAGVIGTPERARASAPRRSMDCAWRVAEYASLSAQLRRWTTTFRLSLAARPSPIWSRCAA